MAPATLYLAVALGAALGGSARWLASEFAYDALGGGFPWGTLFVNIAGSFAIGLYAAWTLSGGRYAASAFQRHFFMTGVCGGCTTFSVFSLETLRLAQSGAIGLAALNVALSVAAWLAAVWAGYVLGLRLRDAG